MCQIAAEEVGAMADYMLEDGLLAMLSTLAAPVFTAPSGASFLSLAAGWLLCRAQRTTSGMLTAANAVCLKHFSSYHRFFSSASWCEQSLRRGLARLLLATLCREGEIVLVGDDTVRAKTGPKIAAAAFWHNHCAAGRQQRTTVWGHSYVLLGLVVRLWGRNYCVPIGLKLYRSQADCRACGLKHRSRALMLKEMVRDVLCCAPERSALLLVDGQYACRDLMHSLPRHLSVITRLRHDAALWAPPRRPQHRNVGRPRTRNGRVPTPARMASDPTRPWQCTAEGHQVKSCRALWYRINKRRINKVVVVEGRSGPRTFICLLCTDPKREDGQIVSSYASRWSIELTIRAAKQQAGLGQGQCRNLRALERQATFTATMMACVMAWYIGEGHRTDSLPRGPWYIQKARASYADMLAHARRSSWRRVIFDTSDHEPLPHEIHLRLAQLLEAAA
jgi:hypothetical protein